MVIVTGACVPVTLVEEIRWAPLAAYVSVPTPEPPLFSVASTVTRMPRPFQHRAGPTVAPAVDRFDGPVSEGGLRSAI